MSINVIGKVLKAYFNRNSMILSDARMPIRKNQVNLHYWIADPIEQKHNLGDYLSYVIVEYLKNKNAIQDRSMEKTKHLYAVGSIIGAGFQNATIWGSGFMNDPQGSVLSRILHGKELRRLDVRAVRGPLSREALLKLGHACPEVYGDPAILMPEIYQPAKAISKREYVLIRHYVDSTADENAVPILTADYGSVIEQLISAERVISSSLHGIILAESYGVPAVLYLPEAVDGTLTLFKYRDYYYGTQRYEFPIARTVQEALEMTPCALPELKEQREGLKNAFPVDLWYEEGKR